MTVSTVEKPIAEVLDGLFENADISYTISDKHIVLNKKGIFMQVTQSKAITGNVVDMNGEPIIGVNVVEKGQRMVRLPI